MIISNVTHDRQRSLLSAMLISVSIVGCASYVDNPWDKITALSKSGQCLQADQYANRQFEGSDLYMAKGVVEAACRNNKEKSIEYVTISAKMGNPRAIEALKNHGISVAPVSKPPTPPVTMKERPPVQPAPTPQRRGFQCINLGNIVDCQ